MGKLSIAYFCNIKQLSYRKPQKELCGKIVLRLNVIRTKRTWERLTNTNHDNLAISL